MSPTCEITSPCTRADKPYTFYPASSSLYYYDTNLIVLASVNVMGISMVSVHGGLPPSAACIVSVSVVFILSAVISLIKLISPVEREVQNINMTNLMLS